MYVPQRLGRKKTVRQSVKMMRQMAILRKTMWHSPHLPHSRYGPVDEHAHLTCRKAPCVMSPGLLPTETHTTQHIIAFKDSQNTRSFIEHSCQGQRGGVWGSSKEDRGQYTSWGRTHLGLPYYVLCCFRLTFLWDVTMTTWRHRWRISKLMAPKSFARFGNRRWFI